MNTEIKDSQRVRVICKRDLIHNDRKLNRLSYLSVPYNIPIVKDGERFLTGQNLSYKQMTGQETMTPEQRTQYPFVINPDNIYKIKHLTWLDKTDPYQKCMIDLLMMTGKWAENKMIYEKDSVIYDGYFEDPITEAHTENVFKDERYDAETCVREAPPEDYSRIALMVNFLAPDVHVNPSLTQSIVLKQLYDICDTRPVIVKKCFAKYNKGVDKDIFLLECMHYDIVTRKDNGDIWYQNEYVGKTLEDVSRFMGKKDNEQLYSKFANLLNQKKGLIVTNLQMDASDNKKIDKNIVLIMECKAAIVDNDYDKALLTLSKVNREAYREEFDRLNAKLDEMKSERYKSRNDGEKEEFITKLNDLSIDDIRKKIEHKLSKYKKEECSDFWDNKEKLIQYMKKIRYKE